MKKRVLIGLMMFLFTICCMFGLVACTGSDNIEDGEKHNHTYEEIVTEPTCTEKGYTTYTCSCKDSYVGNYVDALGHKYAEEWSFDDTHHWHAAICEHTDEKSEKAEHDLKNGVSCAVCGFTQTTSADYFIFTLQDDDTYEVIAKDIDTIPANVVIPSIYEGKPVTTIGIQAFSNCINLKSITIPDSITIIGNYSFEKCYNLTSIIIPDSVTTIGWGAFSNSNKLASIDLPANVDTIGRDAFYNTAVFNDNKNWENGAFYMGNRLIKYDGSKVGLPEEYVIKEGTEVITTGAFYRCDELTKIVIPASVKDVEYWAFYECFGLQEVHITDLVAWCDILFDGETANPLFYAHQLYCNNELVTKITEEDLEGVTSIGNNAFFSCYSLNSVKLPSSVIRIGDNAFNYCKNIIDVEISANYSTIGNAVFSNCSNLEVVVFKENSQIDCISSSMFNNCKKLTSIIIPDSATSIGDYAFYQCDNLSSVNIGENSQITSIGASAFGYCYSLTSITIPELVNRIDDIAFSCCNNLTSAIFKNPNGWLYYESETSFKMISSTELANTAVAAKYLRESFYDCYWVRK